MFLREQTTTGLFYTNVSNEKVDLTWDIELANKFPGELLIYLPNQDIAYDMKQTGRLSIKPTRAKQLEIYYGQDVPREKLGIQLNSYPNPTDGEINFEFYVFGDGRSKTINIEMFTVEGTMIRAIQKHYNSGQWATYQLDSKQLPAGIYLYRVRIENKQSDLQRIIKLQ